MISNLFSQKHVLIKCQVIKTLSYLVDGKWGEWTEFSNCSLECGTGTKERTRVCDAPAPEGDGKNCPGFPNDGYETKNCNTQPCPSKYSTNNLIWSMKS